MMKKIKLTPQTLIIALALLGTGILLGSFLFSGKGTAEESRPKEKATAEGSHAGSEEHLDHGHDATTWTCAMHPQIKREEPGLCPICAMELTPLEETEWEPEFYAFTMSENSAALAGVQTTPVRKSSQLITTITLPAELAIDERTLKKIPAHFHGRIEKLHVNYTGAFVAKGQKIATVYSPNLLTAQQELLEALANKAENPALYKAVREKFRNWKIPEKEIAKIEKRGKVSTTMPVNTHHGGVVQKRYVSQGDHLDMGDPIFEIADLSQLWLLVDAYEQHLSQINIGDTVNFSTQSAPGKSYTAVIEYIDPVIDPQTRVAKLRATITQQNQKLKPGMYGQATVKASGSSNEKPSLVIPRTAVLWTGERSLVYVQVPHATQSAFQYREVKVRPAGSDSYAVLSGLREGEAVVTQGTFTIDAAAQLAGKPSMMNGKGADHASANDATGAMPAAQLWNLILEPYLALKKALAGDHEKAAQESWQNLKESAARWQEQSFAERPPYRELVKALNDNKEASEVNLNSLRQRFFELSIPVIALARQADTLPNKLYVQHCPMAQKNNGADWLSRDKEILNPYFGEDMLRCGSTTAVLQP